MPDIEGTLELIRARLHDQASTLQQVLTKVELAARELQSMNGRAADHESRIRLLERDHLAHIGLQGHPESVESDDRLEGEIDQVREQVTAINRKLAVWAALGSSAGAIIAVFGPTVARLVGGH